MKLLKVNLAPKKCTDVRRLASGISTLSCFSYFKMIKICLWKVLIRCHCHVLVGPSADPLIAFSSVNVALSAVQNHVVEMLVTHHDYFFPGGKSSH